MNPASLQRIRAWPELILGSVGDPGGAFGIREGDPHQSSNLERIEGRALMNP